MVIILILEPSAFWIIGMQICIQVAVSLCIELSFAVLWGYRSKGQLMYIAATCAVTQCCVNVVLGMLLLNRNYDGLLGFLFLLHYILLKLVKMVTEAVCYVNCLDEYWWTSCGKKKTLFTETEKVVAYALFVNILSEFIIVLTGWF